MALKQFKPQTPGQRRLVLVDHSDLWQGKPVKALTRGISKSGGRNNQGKMTVRHIGGGHKRRYRMIDFSRRSKLDMPATVVRFEYDPNRSAFIALIAYKDGTQSYILAPQRLSQGDKLIASEKADTLPGNAMLLKNVPVGTVVHNVELHPGKGGQIARSAGAYVQVAGRDAGYVLLKMPSGELRRVHGDCMATVGAVSNQDHGNTNMGKAGRNRWKGRRPHVRGVAMNPVDHPLGGGEGRSAGGRHPCSPWGMSAKGYKTRKNKSTDKYSIRRRKKKRKG